MNKDRRLQKSRERKRNSQLYRKGRNQTITKNKKSEKGERETNGQKNRDKGRRKGRTQEY